MNGTQVLIAVAYSIVVALSVVALIAIVRSTRRRGDAPGHGVLARNEVRWGWAVAAMLLVLVALTIFQVPYTDTSAGASGQRVAVTAQQFGFALRPAVVRAGVPVEFRLRSRDVQHGFGVYEKSKLLFQVQVPARGQSEQRYVYTFDKPGTYDVLCLEYCGFQHHLMRASIRAR